MINGANSKSAKKESSSSGRFGGVYAALHLEKLLARAPEVEDLPGQSRQLLLFTPMLHEIAAAISRSRTLSISPQASAPCKVFVARSSGSIFQTSRW